MRKRRKKLSLARETILNLEKRQLEDAKGAGSGYASVCNCSVCTGCQHGCISEASCCC